MHDPTLTNLPIEIQSHILRNLSTPPLTSSEAPSSFTLVTARGSVEPFSDDILHTAQASPTLSEAVLYTLGLHKKVLNFHRSKRLPEWISLLRNHVQVVSLAGAKNLRYCDNGFNESECQCDNPHNVILNTLNALHTNKVALRAINLSGLKMTDIDRAEEIAANVVPAIQSSSSSLKEIALHTNRASAMALPHVSLPNLEVAQIYADEYSGHENVRISDISRSAKTLGDILIGLNGHADRNDNFSTVRELRLYNIEQLPIIDEGSSSSLFFAVEELSVLCAPNSKHNEIAKFIANFCNLKILVLGTLLTCAEDMNRIFAGCPQLESLYLFIYERRILPGEINLAQNSFRLNDMFVSLRGKHYTFDIDACLSSSQIESLAVNSPNLETLQMGIDSKNVGALRSLLATHCRKLRTLRLSYSADAIDCLGDNGWPVLAQAICSASDELRTFSLQGDRTGPIIESATSEMVEAITDILEFMGDRATAIAFRVPINTDNLFDVMHALWRTLKVANAQCRSIETLCLDFMRDSPQGAYFVNDDDEDQIVIVLCLILNLRADFNSTRKTEIDLGKIDALIGESDG